MERDWSMRNRKEAGLARLISGALLMVSPALAFSTIRSVGAVVYCVRGVVFLLPTLFFFTVVEQVQMWLLAVDDSFLWASWILAGIKKGWE